VLFGESRALSHKPPFYGTMDEYIFLSSLGLDELLGRYCNFSVIE
jgi:hypothetical protein